MCILKTTLDVAFNTHPTYRCNEFKPKYAPEDSVRPWIVDEIGVLMDNKNRYWENKNKNNMKQLKIEIPNGFVIDEEKSNLQNGEIFFKEKKKQHAQKWEDLEEIKGWWIANDSIINEEMSPFMGDKGDNRNVFKTKKQAESALAKAQLSQLMDEYESTKNVDWKDDNQVKYVISRVWCRIHIDTASNKYEFIAFTSEEEANEFYDLHLDLIKKFYML